MAHANIHNPPQEALNPIFDYAAKGQFYENRREWKSAVHWYQRALACLPNLFGSDQKMLPLNILNRSDISFKPQHASRMYAALGRSLMALGRKRDSLLAFQASGALDPENTSAIKLFETHLPRHADTAPDSVIKKSGPGSKPARVQSDLKRDLTLVMATHCCQRLKKFEALSPPSCKLVTATYGSLLSVFGAEIDACPKIMCYDQNSKGSERETQYAGSIETFSRQNGFSLRKYTGAGLFNVLEQTIQSIETPYIFFVEHDWMFRGERLQLPDLIEMMNADPNINAIRLNKRDNFLNGRDFLMGIDTAPKNCPLMRTSQFSNNPGIIRTEKMKNEWLPICKEALKLVSDKLGGSAFGIEEILFRKFVADIRDDGFDEVHPQWGTYVFGGLGDPPRIVHLGE